MDRSDVIFAGFLIFALIYRIDQIDRKIDCLILMAEPETTTECLEERNKDGD